MPLFLNSFVFNWDIVFYHKSQSFVGRFSIFNGEGTGIKPGPALQADALLYELRRAVSELRITLI
jgi:hypothetical protein